MRSARHWAWTLPLPGLNWRPCLAMRGDSQPKAEAAVTTPAHGPLNFTLGGAGVGGGGWLEASRGCARAGGWSLAGSRPQKGMSCRRVQRQGAGAGSSRPPVLGRSQGNW